jgi:predicted nuclease of predicted toxin-antitoxin system
MKVLLDECVPHRLKRDFGTEHETRTVAEAGFAGLENGQLMRAAAAEMFEVLITVDQNLIHQQDIQSLPLAILVIIAQHNKYEVLSQLVPHVLIALRTIRKGEVLQISASI